MAELGSQDRLIRIRAALTSSDFVLVLIVVIVALVTFGAAAVSARYTASRPTMRPPEPREMLVIQRGTSQNAFVSTPIGGSDDSPMIVVEPASAPADATRHIYATQFSPGEAVQALIVSDDGGQLVATRGRATERGEVWIELAADGLAPGAYTLQLLGAASAQIISATIEIQ